MASLSAGTERYNRHGYAVSNQTFHRRNPTQESHVTQVIVYIVVLLLGLGWFAKTISGRLAVLRTAPSVNRLNNTGERLAGVFRHVFGQWRLLHGDFAAGLMHFFIFWGFIAVLLNTLHFLIGGPTGHFAFPLLGRENTLGGLYLLFRDVFELLVLVAVGYAAYRRVIIRPTRLTESSEALLILALIAILMITDWLLSGAAVLLHGNEPHLLSPAERLLSPLFISSGLRVAGWVYAISWWIHLLTLLFFLNLLPLGKHFHVLTSVFSVYLRNLEPQGEMEKLDFEDEALEDYGVSKLHQFNWSTFLDSYSCTECGRCDYFCPATQTGKELSPKHIITNTRDEVYRHQPALIAQMAAIRRGDMVGADSIAESMSGENGFAQLVGETHTDNVLWACTTCGACDTHCPLFIEHVRPIVEMRRHLVLEEEGRFPSELAATFRGLENQGNPWGIGAHQRMEWAEGLNVPTLEENPEAEWIYFVGCFAALDDRSKPVARAMVELLNAAQVSFAVLDTETCCGDPARRCGHEYLAQALIEVNAEQFKSAKAKKVFSACPHCYNTLKSEYSQFGVKFDEVLHHSQLLARLLNQGRIKPVKPDILGKVAFHDSCYLGRYNSVYYNPRDIIRNIRGTDILEPLYTRDKGFCCGAGGGRMFLEETEGQRVNHFRYHQLAATGAERIAVACPYCMTMLDDAAKELAAEGVRELQVVDIAVALRISVITGSD
jgi:Fe-S oxidoreductase